MKPQTLMDMLGKTSGQCPHRYLGQSLMFVHFMRYCLPCPQTKSTLNAVFVCLYYKIEDCLFSSFQCFLDVYSCVLIWPNIITYSFAIHVLCTW